MSKVKDAIAEHCERHCVPSCDNCRCDLFYGDCLLDFGDAGCRWECGRDDATCFEDAQAAEADRIHDARMEGEL